MMMTVEEMRKAYPNTCIGITDLKFDDRHQIIAGDVKYTDKSETELISMAIDHTGIRPFYTSTSEGGWPLGASIINGSSPLFENCGIIQSAVRINLDCRRDLGAADSG